MIQSTQRQLSTGSMGFTSFAANVKDLFTYPVTLNKQENIKS